MSRPLWRGGGLSLSARRRGANYRLRDAIITSGGEVGASVPLPLAYTRGSEWVLGVIRPCGFNSDDASSGKRSQPYLRSPWSRCLHVSILGLMRPDINKHRGTEGTGKADRWVRLCLAAGRGLEGKQCAWKTGAKALRLIKDRLNEDRGSVSPSRSSRLRVR